MSRRFRVAVEWRIRMDVDVTGTDASQALAGVHAQAQSLLAEKVNNHLGKGDEPTLQVWETTHHEEKAS